MKQKPRDSTPELGGPTDKRTLNVMLGTGFLNQVDQTRKAMDEAPVKADRKSYLPLPLRILSFLGGWCLLFGCIGVISYFLRLGGFGFTKAMALWGLGIGIPVFGGLRLLDSYLEHRAWIRRIREEQRK